MKVTLDMNCIIDLEEGRSSASSIKKLIKLNNNKKIELRIPAISASEKKPDGKYASNIEEFKNKISAIGLGKVKILKPIFYHGFTFWGLALYSSEEMIKLERMIHNILFPQIEFDYREFCENRSISQENKPLNKKWLNAKCDVLSLWCHIYYNGDIFITRDNNFYKKTKLKKLTTLGVGYILTPQQAVVKIADVLKNN